MKLFLLLLLAVAVSGEKSCRNNDDCRDTSHLCLLNNTCAYCNKEYKYENGTDTVDRCEGMKCANDQDCYLKICYKDNKLCDVDKQKEYLRNYINNYWIAAVSFLGVFTAWLLFLLIRHDYCHKKEENRRYVD